MKQLLEAVEKLSVEELTRANEKFPQFQHADEFIKRLKESSLHAAAEAVQVAAMCQKFADMAGKQP
jgi:hypothetical protein